MTDTPSIEDLAKLPTQQKLGDLERKLVTEDHRFWLATTRDKKTLAYRVANHPDEAGQVEWVIYGPDNLHVVRHVLHIEFSDLCDPAVQDRIRAEIVSARDF